MTIPEQLVKIYQNEEWWHKESMSYVEALDYHTTRYHKGDIQVYQEKNEVLGYYERYFIGNTCILYNVWVKSGYRQGKVFKALYKKFFDTMPKHINSIIGEKQKLGGKMMKVRIRRKENGKF